MIVRFLKRVFHLRLPRPKYSRTWDVSIVFNYLKNLEPIEQLRKFKRVIRKNYCLLLLS